jgi:ribosomal protein L36
VSEDAIIFSGSSTTMSIACPTGEQFITGGAEVRDHPDITHITASYPILRQSNPSSPTSPITVSWRASFLADPDPTHDDALLKRDVIVYVLCNSSPTHPDDPQ